VKTLSTSDGTGDATFVSMDEREIRARVGELIDVGAISEPFPSKVWIGASKGHECFVCHTWIEVGERECEVDLASTVTAYLHCRCYDIVVEEIGRERKRA
jgi:hypothetical protein